VNDIPASSVSKKLPPPDSSVISVLIFFQFQFQLSYSYYFSVSITVIYFSVTVGYFSSYFEEACLASKHYGHYLVRLIEGKHWHSLLY